MMSSDEAGLYDAGGDIPLAVFDATNNRAYYTSQMFVDYDGSYLGLADTHNGGGISVNFADGSINIGKAETNAADGIEGIQVYQNGSSPIIRIGSSGFTGNGTLLTVDDSNSHINLSSQCINLGQGNIGTMYISDDCFGGDIGLRNGLNDGEMAVYIPSTDTYRYGGSSLLAYINSDGGFGGDVVSGINLDQDFSYINFAGNPSGAIGSQGYGFRDNNGVMEFKDIGESWTAFSSLSGGGGSSPITIVNSTNLFSTGLVGTGQDVTGIDNSVFLGTNAGYQATNAPNSNFFGTNAGYQAVNANNSNFIGQRAGYGGYDTDNSNFFGSDAGYGATAASSSNFIGNQAGYLATAASSSNFIGNQAGYGANSAYGAVFIGERAGYQATNAIYSNFIGIYAGFEAANANRSNFFGTNAGYQATNATYSNFVGVSAGSQATNASNSNFFGQNAGSVATNASNSNFFGLLAGSNATDAQYSNFFGSSAGRNASGADGANFFGRSAGYAAAQAYQSNFIGGNAGYGAVNAFNSNFLGSNAGSGAIDANNSIIIGVNAGLDDTVDNSINSDDFSILIGNNTSTGGFSNSIAIGGSATNTASNQFMIGSTTRPINEVVIKGSGTCSIVATGISCSSDERLKTNIEDLENTTLDIISNIRTVRYNWNSDPTGDKTIGFLAQDLEQYYPELVRTDSYGFKMVNYAQMTPSLVEAIREMNLKITDINNIETSNTWRDALIAWFENTGNGIRSLVVHDKICVDDQCLTKDDIKALLEIKNSNTPVPTSIPTIVPEENTPTDNALTCTDPQILNETGDACIDPEPAPVSEEIPPTDTSPTEEPPTVTE